MIWMNSISDREYRDNIRISKFIQEQVVGWIFLHFQQPAECGYTTTQKPLLQDMIFNSQNDNVTNGNSWMLFFAVDLKFLKGENFTP